MATQAEELARAREGKSDVYRYDPDTRVYAPKEQITSTTPSMVTIGGQTMRVDSPASRFEEAGLKPETVAAVQSMPTGAKVSFDEPGKSQFASTPSAQLQALGFQQQLTSAQRERAESLGLRGVTQTGLQQAGESAVSSWILSGEGRGFESLSEAEARRARSVFPGEFRQGSIVEKGGFGIYSSYIKTGNVSRLPEGGVSTVRGPSAPVQYQFRQGTPLTSPDSITQALIVSPLKKIEPVSENVRKLDLSAAVRLNQVLGLYDIASGKASGPVTYSTTAGAYFFKDLSDPLINYVLTGVPNKEFRALSESARYRLELESRSELFGKSTGLDRARLIGEGLLTSESLDLIKAGLVGSKEDVDRSLGLASLKLSAARKPDGRFDDLKLLSEFSQSAPGIYTLFGVGGGAAAGLATSAVPALATGAGARLLGASANVALSGAGQLLSGRRDTGELLAAGALGAALPSGASSGLSRLVLPSVLLGVPAVVPAYRLIESSATFKQGAGNQYSFEQAVGDYASGLAFTGLVAAGAVASGRGAQVISQGLSRVKLFEPTRPGFELTRESLPPFSAGTFDVKREVSNTLFGKSLVSTSGYMPSDFSPTGLQVLYSGTRPSSYSGVVRPLNVNVLASSLKSPTDKYVAEQLLREQLTSGSKGFVSSQASQSINFGEFAVGRTPEVSFARTSQGSKAVAATYALFKKYNPDTVLYKKVSNVGVVPAADVGTGLRFVEVDPGDVIGRVSSANVVGASAGSRSGGSQVFSGKVFSFEIAPKLGLVTRSRVGQSLEGVGGGVAGGFVKAPREISSLKFDEYAVYRNNAIELYGGGQAGSLTSYARFRGENAQSVKPIFTETGVRSEILGTGASGIKFMVKDKVFGQVPVKSVVEYRERVSFDPYGVMIGKSEAMTYTPEGVVSSRVFGAKPVAASVRSIPSAEVPLSELTSRLVRTREPGLTVWEQARASIPRGVVLSRGSLGGEGVSLRSSGDIGYFRVGGSEFSDVFRTRGGLSVSSERVGRLGGERDFVMLDKDFAEKSLRFVEGSQFFTGPLWSSVREVQALSGKQALKISKDYELASRVQQKRDIFAEGRLAQLLKDSELFGLKKLQAQYAEQEALRLSSVRSEAEAKLRTLRGEDVLASPVASGVATGDGTQQKVVSATTRAKLGGGSEEDYLTPIYVRLPSKAPRLVEEVVAPPREQLGLQPNRYLVEPGFRYSSVQSTASGLAFGSISQSAASGTRYASVLNVVQEPINSLKFVEPARVAGQTVYREYASQVQRTATNNPLPEVKAFPYVGPGFVRKPESYPNEIYVREKPKIFDLPRFLDERKSVIQSTKITTAKARAGYVPSVLGIVTGTRGKAPARLSGLEVRPVELKLPRLKGF